MREVAMTRQQLRNLFLLHWSPAAAVAVAIVTQIYFSSDFGADLWHTPSDLETKINILEGLYQWRVVLLATDENVSACPPPQEPANVH